MMQKEVAERVCARAGSKDYSCFSIFVQSLSTPRMLFIVKPTCFYPRPQVDSAVVEFILHPPPLSPPEPFFQFTRTIFQSRRKMLTTSLKCLGEKEVAETLVKLGKSSQARPQELSPSEFLSLFLQLYPKTTHS